MKKPRLSARQPSKEHSAASREFAAPAQRLQLAQHLRVEVDVESVGRSNLISSLPHPQSTRDAPLGVGEVVEICIIAAGCVARAAGVCERLERDAGCAESVDERSGRSRSLWDAGHGERVCEREGACVRIKRRKWEGLGAGVIDGL